MGFKGNPKLWVLLPLLNFNNVFSENSKLQTVAFSLLVSELQLNLKLD